jgi:predicted RNase H-like HicB family nuclease
MIDSTNFVFEQTGTGFSAYSPQYPGVGVAAKTREEAERMLREAIAFYLEEAAVSFDYVGISQIVFPSHALDVMITGPRAFISAAPYLVKHA